MILFPDTHLFLHFRDLRELPWDEVTADPAIYLVVGRTIQKELEKKKHDLRGRPQDRARTYARKLAEIVTSKAPLVVREKSPRVTLDFMPRQRGWVPPADLDPQWQDDQLVADALAFTDSHPNEAVAILTGDAGVIATADMHGVSVVRPSEGWEMSAEPSLEEKALKKLQLENHELKQRGPKLSAELMQKGNELIRHIELTFDWYAPLSETEMGIVLNEVKAKHPKVHIFDRRPSGEVADPAGWDLPSDEAIEAYRTNYDEWLRDIAIFIRSVAKGSTKAEIQSDFEIHLRNIGTEPALRTRFSLEVGGNLSLWSDEDKADGDKDSAETGVAKDEILVATPFRGPPTAPTPRRRRPALPEISKWQALGRIDPSVLSGFSRHEQLLRSLGPADQISKMLGSHRADIFGSRFPLAQATAIAQPVIDLAGLIPPFPRERNPHKFYWRAEANEKNGATKWELDCDEYPHQDEAEIFKFYLIFHSTEERDHEGALRVRIAANNLRAPLDITYQVKVRCIRADTVSCLRSLLPF